MDTQSNVNTKRLATLSLILGILSFGLVSVALIIIIRLRLPGAPSDDASTFSLGFLAVFLLLGGLILGIPGLITGLNARKKNEEAGDNQTIRRIATIGLRLSVTGVTIVVILFAYALIFRTSTPPPDISTPIPSTAIP